MFSKVFAFLCVLALALASSSAQQQQQPAPSGPQCDNPITNVPNFDIESYMGKWYAVSGSRESQGPNAPSCSCISVTNTFRSGGGKTGFSLEGVCAAPSGPVQFVGDALHLGGGVFDLFAIPKSAIPPQRSTATDQPSARDASSSSPTAEPPKPTPNFVVLFSSGSAAVVSDTCRENVHILSRSPTISKAAFDELAAVAREAGVSATVTQRENSSSC